MRSSSLLRRHRERLARIARARAFAADLDPALQVRAVVVFGSVARGDFNLWSDIDVVVVAERLPDRLLERLDAVGAEPGVQPIVWTPAEWAAQHRRGNPIVVESISSGVWLVGGPEGLPEL